MIDAASATGAPVMIESYAFASSPLLAPGSGLLLESAQAVVAASTVATIAVITTGRPRVRRAYVDELIEVSWCQRTCRGRTAGRPVRLGGAPHGHTAEPGGTHVTDGADGMAESVEVTRLKDQ